MDLAAHPAFAAGDVDTDFIPRHKSELFPDKTPTSRQVGKENFYNKRGKNII